MVNDKGVLGDLYREGASIDLDDRIQAARLACWRHLWAIQRDKGGRDPKFKPRSCAC